MRSRVVQSGFGFPESLVASHLPPCEFVTYLAVGAKKRTRGQSIYFELYPEKIENLPWDYIEKKLVLYADGEPKRWVFLSIYRVLENVPLDSLRNLYLVTDDGKVLELTNAEYKLEKESSVHLYQQFNPITTRVASRLSLPRFHKISNRYFETCFNTEIISHGIDITYTYLRSKDIPFPIGITT